VAAAHFQRQNRVQWIDGGAYLQNDRGVLAAPRLLGGMSDSVPAHGNYAAAALHLVRRERQRRVWRESDLAAGNLHADAHAQQRRGAPRRRRRDDRRHRRLVAARGGRHRPRRRGRVRHAGAARGQHAHLPNLHGLAVGASGALFGCSDGVLLVSGQNGRATFTKITRTDDPRFGSGTVWARRGSPNFLARINIRGAP
jgi:hypothetical protein